MNPLKKKKRILCKNQINSENTQKSTMHAIYLVKIGRKDAHYRCNRRKGDICKGEEKIRKAEKFLCFKGRFSFESAFLETARFVEYTFLNSL